MEKKKILVVEDDDSIRKIMRIVLGNNFDVIEAASATEALSVLQDETVSGVVSDYHMPKMNGLEFVRALRLDSRWQNIPVLMVSSFLTKGHSTAASAAGVSKLITKPFDLKEFQGEVQKLIPEVA